MSGSKCRCLKVDLRGKETGPDEGRHGGWRAQLSHRRRGAGLLPETRHHGLIKYNVRGARDARAATNGSVRGDVLIKRKVLLLRVRRRLRREA